MTLFGMVIWILSIVSVVLLLMQSHFAGHRKMKSLYWSMIAVNLTMFVSDLLLITNDFKNQVGLAPFFFVQFYSVWMALKGLKKVKEEENLPDEMKKLRLIKNNETVH